MCAGEPLLDENTVRHRVRMVVAEMAPVKDVPVSSESELTEIVHKSAAAAGLVYEPDQQTGERLDERILLDAQGKNTLPLLEFALEQLFKRLKVVEIEAADHAPARIERRLTFAAYNAMQRLDGAINQSAENALAELGNAELEALPRLLRYAIPFILRMPTQSRPLLHTIAHEVIADIGLDCLCR